MEFKRGTYISQVLADGPAEAQRVWAAALDLKLVPGLTADIKTTLIKEMAEGEPTPIQGMGGVWSAWTRPPGGEVHFVETVRRDGT